MATYAERFRHVAGAEPDRDALLFHTGPAARPVRVTRTYGELDRAARTVGEWLSRHCAPGDRALLMYPAGPAFVEAMLGCLYAGVVPVPVPLPGQYGPQSARATGIAADCAAAVVLTGAATLPLVTARLAAEDVAPRPLATDTLTPAAWDPPAAGPDALALLQYTSGSTSDPKGVMVSQANLLHNIETMRDRHGWDRDSVFCGWLPGHHDMGLIAMLLTPLLLGARTIITAPTDFLKRPRLWLELISEFRATVSCAPNFAYDLCARLIADDQLAGLDLSTWRDACNGAEPIDPGTLDRFARRFAAAGFRREALLPGYGLAETTLYVSGAGTGRPPVLRDVGTESLHGHRLRPPAPGETTTTLVSSGTVHDLTVRIVDPDTAAVLPDGTVGEIWVSGASVARGYWGRPDETARTFGARTGTGDGPFLRTGDLGALLDGELYVTGRIKETLILHGRNLYPHDLERRIAEADERLAALPSCVFTVPGPPERLVVVQEARGRHLTAAGLEALAGTVRATLTAHAGTSPAAVVFVRPGRIERTTSGKIRRNRMRELYLAGQLDPILEDPARPGYPPYALTETLESELGSPHLPGHTFSLARCLELDAREDFPDDVCALLDKAGIPAWYVPAAHGGAARSFEETLQVVRLMARRDLTVAIAHGKTFLGAVSAWVADDPAAAARMSADVLAGAVVSWGLTERDHGSDLLAGEVEGRPTADGWTVDGEKWLINNATRSDVVCLLTRTDPGGGPRGFSMLLMDKRRLPAGTVTHLPAVRLHGIRGADISGITFTGAPARHADLVGRPGEGLELVIKGMQLTRTLCAGLSLGAADRALRLTLDFATGHRLYDRVLADLPQARHTLCAAYADLLTAEAVTLVATRSLHALPGEQSIASAVVKYLVPTLVDDITDRLAGVLGARSLLTDGTFQKVRRDHHIVGIFDGSTLVNLNMVINQFGVLAAGYRAGRADRAGLDAAAGLHTPVPAFDPGRLSLVARHGASVVQTLAEAADGLPAPLAALAGRLHRAADRLHRQMAAQPVSARDVPESSYTLAERYCRIWAAAACLHLWRRTPAETTGPAGLLWRDELWVRACLTRALQHLGEPAGDDLTGLAAPMLGQHRDGLLFSPLTCRLREEQP
ncbi:AMP-binding protein [Catenuloplanes indicus]|uniref:Acyl-CoA synthetase (AMP-forming)/AMP-acid ligase II/alkylation response protein AidB-like acyl-CoA dehydrogenase n=1 Tax=Catenuloplanes indicus TaxID=137267 RepID=A0AAE4AVD8_9ACTN|nr:AMP-binding protein [Catenuloplanes indicus]MDQ0363887.1 acyl-CoA synthetase (AMP-forming)/AMP-acid ligase II/alkylation response protein AidB-like acyl-CoA dehydrogenase [Catenuloplanes indicus]